MKWSSQDKTNQKINQAQGMGEINFPAFAPLHFDAFETLRGLPEPISIPAGTIILGQDAPCEYVWLLRDGLVRLSYTTQDGRETTLGLRTAGWFAGAANVMTSVPSVCSVKTLTPCLASRIAAKDFAEILARRAKLTRHFLSSLCCELLAQTSAQARLMSESAEQRLATFMRERQQQYPQWRTVDTLPLLKQRELAQLLSITPEHLSRLLHKGHGGPATTAVGTDNWMV